MKSSTVHRDGTRRSRADENRCNSSTRLVQPLCCGESLPTRNYSCPAVHIRAVFVRATAHGDHHRFTLTPSDPSTVRSSKQERNN